MAKTDRVISNGETSVRVNKKKKKTLLILNLSLFLRFDMYKFLVHSLKVNANCGIKVHFECQSTELPGPVLAALF